MNRSYFSFALIFALLTACSTTPLESLKQEPVSSPNVNKLLAGGVEQTKQTRIYDAAYVRLAYPNGDVPIERGVCADVVIRAFRKAGVDLQKEVHEDLSRNFSSYPQRWGLTRPDTNIDHRRVPNLMTFFQRKGKAVAITDKPQDYRPGDAVAWDIGGGLLHIGLVTNYRAGDNERFQIVHNIGWGAQIEDRLFDWRIIGHYRYFD